MHRCVIEFHWFSLRFFRLEWEFEAHLEVMILKTWQIAPFSTIWIRVKSNKKHRYCNDFHWLRDSGVASVFARNLTKISIFKLFLLISSFRSWKWIRTTSCKNIDFLTTFSGFEPRELKVDSHTILKKYRFLNEF